MSTSSEESETGVEIPLGDVALVNILNIVIVAVKCSESGGGCKSDMSGKEGEISVVNINPMVVIGLSSLTISYVILRCCFSFTETNDVFWVTLLCCSEKIWRHFVIFLSCVTLLTSAVFFIRHAATLPESGVFKYALWIAFIICHATFRTCTEFKKSLYSTNRNVYEVGRRVLKDFHNEREHAPPGARGHPRASSSIPCAPYVRSATQPVNRPTAKFSLPAGYNERLPKPSAPPLDVPSSPNSLQRVPVFSRFEEVANLPSSGLFETHRAVVTLVPRDGGSADEVIELRGLEVNLEGLNAAKPEAPSTLVVQVHRANSPTCQRSRGEVEKDSAECPPTYGEATSAVGRDKFRQV